MSFRTSFYKRSAHLYLQLSILTRRSIGFVPRLLRACPAPFALTAHVASHSLFIIRLCAPLYPRFAPNGYTVPSRRYASSVFSKAPALASSHLRYSESSATLLSFFIIVLTLPAMACATPSAVAQSGELLKGTIQKQGFLNPDSDSEQFGGTVPGLNRKDMQRSRRSGADPFDNGNSEHGEASVNVPSSATTTALVPPPAPYGHGPGTPENGIPQNLQPEPSGSDLNKVQQPGMGKLQATVSAANDPDQSAEMQLAWDAWHKRVAAAIFQRFDFFAHSAFKYSPPLLARVDYVVTHDGHIQNLAVTQHSSNPMFDLLIIQCVKSLDGDHQLLQFPPGSQRMSVEKFGTFTQNYGIEGFRYTTGDRETIRR